MPVEPPAPIRARRLNLDPLHMTLRRQSRLRPAAQFSIRMAIMIGMIVIIVAFHWIERDSLKDQIDGHVSFSDVIYFTMISATTTGYGDIVPVTDRARLFDALVVTPIRVFFLLLLAGTAYTFIIKQTWNRWLMKLIQKNLHDHILIAGFGVSNDKALEELLARGTLPKRIVVIDNDRDALDRAAECGVAVLQGDATRDETLLAAHVDRAAALLISTGRDDSNILVVLTARKLSAKVNISVTISETDNEDLAKQAGADTVINPVSFTGLLLAGSLEGPYRAEYLSDLATSEGKVMLRERIIGDEEAGRAPHEVCGGQIVRLVREGRVHAAGDPAFHSLRSGDRVLEIIDSA
ncbi:potassium channel family protein [Sphingomonas sp. RG327]|uniref:Potassium channel family protein n=1 Tax=Sphingomonas anseongensis TaxID=2908207 RepID=A0ABT0REH1_9SPHN|nr:potassium channel family protein [Sphingomonas anseongensis]MCL6678643.1 potassium channel family protein [Sphingomonas anseongensis]